MALRELIVIIKAISNIEGITKMESAHKVMTHKMQSQIKRAGSASTQVYQKVEKIAVATFTRTGKVMNTMLRGFDLRQNRVMRGYLKGVQKATEGIGKFRMEFLGLMFFGMQMRRIFEEFFRGMLEGYLKITRAQTALGRQVTALTAQWTFLKFAIIEAMAPGLIMLVGQIMNVLEWMSALSPATQKWIGWMIVAGAAIGFLIQIIGQLALGGFSLYIVFGGLYGILADVGTMVGIKLAGYLTVLIGIWAVWILSIFSASVLIYELLKRLGLIQWAIPLVDHLRKEFKLLWAILWLSAAPFLFIIAVIHALIFDFEHLGDQIDVWWQETVWAFNEVKTNWKNLVDFIFRNPLEPIMQPIREWGITSRIKKYLPSFQHGGIVPGPIGKPTPVIAHGGEQFMGSNTSFGGITVNVSVPAMTAAIDETRTGEIIGEAVKYKLSRMVNVGSVV